jgi:glucose-1-phosphate thymidylyltransferase
MKGILLAGGTGSRLYPTTRSINKHLLPIYDKPMIFYSLSVLMLAGIREIALISTARDVPLFRNLLGDGEDLGIAISYFTQDDPKGIAEAFLITEKFISNENCALVLGDNIFFGFQFSDTLKNSLNLKNGANIFTTIVDDPRSFAVAEVDTGNKIRSIIEKPKETKSKLAVTGLYFYDKNVCDIAKSITPSERGELEITDINKYYLELGSLSHTFLGRGFAWLDTGTNDSMLSASEFIRTIEKRQGLKIACLEEIAFNNQWITIDHLKKSSLKNKNSNYGAYVQSIIDGHC